MFKKITLNGIGLSKFSKIIWYLRDVKLPQRQELSYINFCIHSERLYDDTVYKSLLRFSKDVLSLTGSKITVCVSSPLCPLVREPIIKNNSSLDVFTARVKDVANFAQIGYHGHFYRENENKNIQISRDNYDKDIVREQIHREMEWFKIAGIYPKVYVAGWWFLASDIVLDLERFGIKVDVSVREGRGDTFGGKYLDDVSVPQCGKPFILPPSKNIVEIQSIFGPVMPTLLMKGYLSKYLDKNKTENLFFIFPLHDWDIPKHYRHLLSNIVELCRHKESIGWMDILKMRDLYLTKSRGTGESIRV